MTATSSNSEVPDKESIEEDNLFDTLSDGHTLFGLPINEGFTQLEALPESELKLLLAGTFSNSTPTSASALISEPGKSAKRYFIGDLIADDVELVKVEKELVVIRRNHQDEVLKLPNFGTIKTGPELDYKDRSLFLERNLVSATAEKEQSLSSNNEFDIDTSNSTEVKLPEYSSSGRSTLQNRLSDLRSRYSE